MGGSWGLLVWKGRGAVPVRQLLAGPHHPGCWAGGQFCALAGWAVGNRLAWPTGANEGRLDPEGGLDSVTWATDFGKEELF